MDLISIIIPYYKNREFIGETLNSIIKQSYKNFEIIIVYDDEDQSDLKYLKDLVNDKANIKILVNDKNYGAGISRNYAIENSKGEFVAFIDSDDYWHEDKLLKQINFMLKNKADFSHTSYYIVNDKKKIVSLRKSRDFDNYKKLLGSCDIGLSTVMIRKNILNDNLFPNITTKEDFILWLNILKKGIKLLSLDEPLTFWRKSRKSLSSNNMQKIFDGYKVYRRYMKMGILVSLYYLFLLSINSFLK